MSEPSLPTLLVPLATAKEKITAQIEQGREILKSLTPSKIGLGFNLGPAFERAEADQTKWAKYNIDLLKSIFSGKSIANEFGPSWIATSSYEGQIEGFKREMRDRILRLESIVQRLPLFPVAAAKTKAKTTVVLARSKQQSRDIFIVHGQDEAAKYEVARFIEQLALHPIILHEKPDKGRTIIEKFEDHSDVGFAVVLLTPDDIGYPEGLHTDAKPRPRQNVMLELGFFLGKLGRNRVCALQKGEIEIPTDYAGVLYKTMDAMGAWKFALAKEIRRTVARREHHSFNHLGPMIFEMG